MSLRIIYGTSGTGKSTYIFQEIAKKLNEQNNKTEKNNSNTYIKIITPEQFSFTLEQKLLKSTTSNSVLTAEVVTFNRMAYRILEEVGRKN